MTWLAFWSLRVRTPRWKRHRRDGGGTAIEQQPATGEIDTMEGSQGRMTRSARFGFWLAASCLLLAMERGRAPERALEAAVQPGAKANAPAPPGSIGLIDVRQSDLEQTAIEDNWVSYNGDYTGRRYSSMTQITPANAGHLVAKWVFHTQEV